jgi:ATP-dependent RNA helicase RhlE
MSFSQLKLSPEILKAVTEKGYDKPSPIQAKAIPAILQGNDVMAAAQTGTGKTAGFTLPILELLSKGEPARANKVRALILTPTRELAAQVGQNVSDYGKNLRLNYAVVFGGVKINPQMMKLRKGVDILVATPGRLLDLHQQNAVRFDQIEILVLDEADRMLDMGFINDIKKILNLLPKRRQNLLFSATFSHEIRQLAKGLVQNPVEISVSPANSTVESVTHSIIPVDKRRKAELLIHLLHENHWQQVLVFSRTKHGANKLTKQLEKERLPAAAIHGNKSQGARTKALAQFKANKIQVLVATDIAARGIDISQLPYVINFDLPNVPEDYVHRIGRTGRAGASGQAISLVSADEFKQLSDIERVIKQIIPRNFIDGFEPDHDLPVSNLNTSARRAQSPRPNSQKPNRNNRSNNSASKRKPEQKNSSSTQKDSKPKDTKAYSGSKPSQNAKANNGKPNRKPAGKPASKIGSGNSSNRSDSNNPNRNSNKKNNVARSSSRQNNNKANRNRPS